MGELEGDSAELPFNLVEHSLEQGNTQISKLTEAQWLNFDPSDETVISSVDAEYSEN